MGEVGPQEPGGGWGWVQLERSSGEQDEGEEPE